MKEKTLERILAQCLEEVEQTGDIRSVLREYPEHATELRALLELAEYAQRSYADVPEPPGGLVEGRARLLREARRDSDASMAVPLIFMIFPTIRDDARYQEGLAHLQAGEWQEAVACLQELLQEHPESQEFAQTLDGVPFQADVEAEVRAEPTRRAIPWRPFVYGGLVLVIILSVGLHVLRFVREGALPGVPGTQTELQRTEWLMEGQEHLEAGELDEAQARFAAVLDQQPGDEEALQGLEQVAEQRVVRDLYEQAVARQEAGDYEQALELLTKVSVRSPDYRDVSERIAAIDRRRGVDTLFGEAEEAYREGRAAEALAAYERIKDLDADYRGDLIDARLFELHMELGREMVTQQPPVDEDPPGAQVLAQAMEHFAQAVALRPSSAEAAGERQLAITCARGLSAYEAGRWDSARGFLRSVFEERPDYLGGAVAETLYQVYLGSAERYEESGNLELAYQELQRAIGLPVDSELAQERAAALAARLTPTPEKPATPGAP